MFNRIKRDIDTVFKCDPAARSFLEVVLCYPGLHAMWGYRLSHRLWRHGAKLAARWISHVFRCLTGIEIHPGAKIGENFFIDHGMGVVIGETTEIGNNVTLYQAVTLGGTSLEKGKRHPTLEDSVIVGSGAKVLGPITIGERSRIGANAVVVNSVQPNSIVVGVPGRDIKRSQPHADGEAPDLNHGNLPDVIRTQLDSLLERVDSLENQVGKNPELRVYTSEVN